MAFFAAALRGTSRSFPPLPLTMSASFAPRRRARQGDELRDPKPRRVEELEQAGKSRGTQSFAARPFRIRDPFGRAGKKPIHFGDREDFRQSAAELWSGNHRGGIVAPPALGLEETVKLTQRRKPPRAGGGLEAALGEPRQEGSDVRACGADLVGASAFEEGEVILDVALISEKRVLGAAALGRQHGEKGRRSHS